MRIVECSSSQLLLIMPDNSAISWKSPEPAPVNNLGEARFVASAKPTFAERVRETLQRMLP
ncbi:MAG: hypothetical protein R3C60_12110 [Parvularculaceae bacterium]